MTDETNLFGDHLPRLGAPLFAERWSNRKSALIGYYAGQGYTAPKIEAELEEAGTANTIAHMLNEWGIYLTGPLYTYAKVPVPMAAKHRSMLAREAAEREMRMPELCARILTQVAVDRLYAAVLEA